MCASLVGGVAAPVLSTTHDAYAAVTAKPQVNGVHSSVIQFKDPVLKKYILSEMKKQNLISWSAQNITEADALKVSDLNLLDSDVCTEEIHSLDGLESFKNLTNLGLLYGQISDITPLKGLTRLTSLYLNYSHISNLSLFKDLPNLIKLSLNFDQISDVTPLKDLPNLKKLCLYGNNISDLSPFAGLTNLTELWLTDNKISDLSPLAGLTNLKELWLSANHISDLTPLKGLTKLRTLYVTGQTINLQPSTPTVDLKKEIKGFGNVSFEADENITNGVLAYKTGMKNPYQVKVSEKNGEHEYSATINVDFSNAKSPIIQFKDQALKQRILSEMKKTEPY